MHDQPTKAANPVRCAGSRCWPPPSPASASAAFWSAPDAVAVRAAALAQNLSQQAQQRRSVRRLCRHRREGEARGDLGPRQDATADAQRRPPTTTIAVPQGLADGEASSSASACPRAADGRAHRAAAQFGQAQGSGFFISADGYAVTNNHVVEKADERRGHDRRRQDPQRQGDRHRSAHRSRADQGRRRQLPLCQARGQPRRASATGCSRSAIRSASAAP